MKKIFYIGLPLMVSLALLVFLINVGITWSTREDIHKEVKNISNKEVGIILGARVYSNGTMSDILKDRVDTGIELYKKEKVKKLLISGDHGQEKYDEVNTIKNYILKKNIAPEDIFLDHAGFDTYDSLYRAKEVFQVKSAIVITQEFHLPRAVYIGKSLNINTIGMIADKQPYLGMARYKTRECLARIKAFLNVILKSKPRFLGDIIPVSGDGRASWD